MNAIPKSFEELGLTFLAYANTSIFDSYHKVHDRSGAPLASHGGINVKSLFILGKEYHIRRIGIWLLDRCAHGNTYSPVTIFPGRELDGIRDQVYQDLFHSVAIGYHSVDIHVVVRGVHGIVKIDVLGFELGIKYLQSTREFPLGLDLCTRLDYT